MHPLASQRAHAFPLGIQNYAEINLGGRKGNTKLHTNFFIQRFKQALSKQQPMFVYPYSKTIETFLQILRRAGIVEGFYVVGTPAVVYVYIANAGYYTQRRLPVINSVTGNSLPVFCNYSKIRLLSKNNKQLQVYRSAKMGGFCTQ